MKPIDRLLNQAEALFVDRDPENKFFENKLRSAATEQRIYYIQGDEAIGKSFLLFHFYKHCLNSNCMSVWIDFSKGQGQFTNYLGVLRDIQLTLEQPFENYQRRTADNLQIPVTVKTGSGDSGKALEIGEDVELEGVTLSGQYAARDINNFYLQVSNRDQALQQSSAIRQLTEAFLDDLTEFVNEQMIIFFFDDIGSDPQGKPYLDPQTRRWLVEDFILPLYDRLPTARFVITQYDKPEAWLQTAIFEIAEFHTLKEFPEEEAYAIYRTYLVDKHNFPPDDINPLVLGMFHDRVKGQPSLMLGVVQRLKQMLQGDR